VIGNVILKFAVAGAVLAIGWSAANPAAPADRPVCPDRAVDSAREQVLRCQPGCRRRAHPAPSSAEISAGERWTPARIGVSRTVERRLSVPRSSRTRSENAAMSSVS